MDWEIFSWNFPLAKARIERTKQAGSGEDRGRFSFSWRAKESGVLDHQVRQPWAWMTSVSECSASFFVDFWALFVVCLVEPVYLHIMLCFLILVDTSVFLLYMVGFFLSLGLMFDGYIKAFEFCPTSFEPVHHSWSRALPSNILNPSFCSVFKQLYHLYFLIPM